LRWPPKSGRTVAWKWRRRKVTRYGRLELKTVATTETPTNQG
jgi:hypothetical protein